MDQSILLATNIIAGIISKPKMSSILLNGEPVTMGSIIDVKNEVVAMVINAIEAFASFTDP